jgi:hypothetical protein
MAIAGPVFANPCPPGDPPTNCGPPTGDVVFDLAASSDPAIPHSYTEYTTTFVATSSTTDLAFAFREDPAVWELDNVSVTAGGSGPNLVADGTFAASSPSLIGTAWNYTNYDGVQAGNGYVGTGCGVVSGSNCWSDGSVQGYDGLNQSISTITGDEYTLSFYLNDTSLLTTAQQLGTPGDGYVGNAADVLAYANSVAAAPEIDPASLSSALSLLLGGLAILRGRKYGGINPLTNRGPDSGWLCVGVRGILVTGWLTLCGWVDTPRLGQYGFRCSRC